MPSFKTHIEIEVTVNYDYQPYEAETRTDPKVDADIENMNVELKLAGNYSADITPALDKGQLENLREECLNEEGFSHY